MPWNPADDVIAVQRGPEPGGAGGAYRVFGETLRGLKTTFGRILEGPVTIQYPEEKVPVYPRFRGRHRLNRFEDTGLEKCVGCSLCAAACPADCIRVVAAENTAEIRVSAGERYAAVYEINMTAASSAATARWPARSTPSRSGNDYEPRRLHPLGSDLHQGDAPGRAARAHSAARRGVRVRMRGLLRVRMRGLPPTILLESRDRLVGGSG